MPALAAFAAAAFTAAVTVVSTVAATVGAAWSAISAVTVAGIKIGTLLKLINTGLMLYSLTRKPKAGGGQPATIAFKADPNAPIPFVGGTAATGGNIVLAQTHGPKNRYLSYVTVLSHGGQIGGYESFTANDEAVAFTSDGGEGATGKYRHRMWQKFGLGAIGAAALIMTATGTKDTPADHGPTLNSDWGTAHKLSGMAHTLWTLSYDPERYPNGTPKPLWVVNGYAVYDPRKDSTYPGGDGPQRADDQSTWSHVGNENPYLQALTFLLGFHFEGVRVGGAGCSVSGIDVAAFVHGANVCDANGWKTSFVWNTAMRKWDVLATFLQSGAGQPLVRGSKISCVVDAPRVSIGTIEPENVRGDASLTGSGSVRERINGIIPRYRSPEHRWTEQPGGLVTASAYQIEDGGERFREVTYEAITLAAQVRQIAAYDLAAQREGIVATIPCDLSMLQYRTGDCLTVNVPDLLLNGQKVIVLKREFDVASSTVTLTVRSETDGKHAWALGQVAEPPPTPTLTGIDPTVVQPPAPEAWEVEPGVAPGGDTAGDTPVIVVETTDADGVGGRYDDASATHIVARYRQVGTLAWAYAEFPLPAARVELTGLAPETAYEVELAYRARGYVGQFEPFGTVTTGALTATTATGLGTGDDFVSAEDIIGDIEDLFTVYGDTASAAASAAAAAASASASATAADLAEAAEADAVAARNAAQAARDLAQAAQADAEAASATAVAQALAASASASTASGHASSAAGSATAAATSAGAAATSAGQAATSATNAAGSASAASTSASTAAASATSAALRLAAMFPPRPDSTASAFSTVWTGTPAAQGAVPGANIENLAGYGYVLLAPSATNAASPTFVTREAVPATAGRIYEVEAVFELVSLAGGATAIPNISSSSLLSDYTQTDGTSYSGGAIGATLTVGEIRTVTAKFSNVASTGVSQWADAASAVWLRFSARLDRAGGASSWRVRSFTVRDVTARSAAEASATAAATSATSAATSATAAGTSATSASTSATTATTAAGTAGTHATNAATSATNAAGSATSAATSAGVAASASTAAQTAADDAEDAADAAGTSATNAATSATAASASASSAAASATAAGTSASAASSSATTASTAAGTAGTHATNAATSATNAAGSATAAATSATVSATAGASAQSVANRLLPDRPSVAADFVSSQTAGAPDTATPVAVGTVVPVAGEGDVRQFATWASIYTRGGLAVGVGRTFRVDVRQRTTVDGTNNRLFRAVSAFDSSWAYLGDVSTVLTAQAVADGWQSVGHEVTSAEITTAYPSAAYIRARGRPGVNNAGASSGATVQVAVLRLRDVTSESAASASASAAATSATAALASETAAGASASAAQTARLAAETAQGAAATSASSAATSATNAAGSASAASTSASTAASSYASARDAAALLFPDRMDATGSMFSEQIVGDPATRTITPARIVSTASGFAYERVNNALEISTRQVMPFVAGRVYEVEAEVEATVAPTPAAADLRIGHMDSTYALLGSGGYSYAGAPEGYKATPVGSRVILRHRFGNPTPTGGTALTAGAAFLRFSVRANLNATRTAFLSDATTRVHRLTVRDVTALAGAELQASAAATSATAAATSATAAGTSATSASTSATTATTAAGTAGTHATNAATSATNAAGSATSAATSATVSATSAASAQSVANRLLPDRPAVAADFTSNAAGGSPDTVPSQATGTVVAVAGEGDVRQWTALGVCFTKGVHAVGVGQTFRLESRTRITADAGSPVFKIHFYALDSSYTLLGAMAGSTSPVITAADGWVSRTLEYTSSQIVAAYPTAAYVRARLAGGGNVSDVSQGATWQASTLRFRNVTAESAAAASASAAATSASSAATSATAAGTSASAASSSATTASTAAGTAGTHATNAATSATSAAGSATAAATSATTAANSATAAGNSATAAATSATAAATSATAAGNSATAAAASAVSADSRYVAMRGTVAASPIIPFDFRDGFNQWTGTRAGDPNTISSFNGSYASSIVTDTDLGQCAEITGFTAAGHNILTRAVVPATAGRTYSVKFRFKVVSSDGSAAFNGVISQMVAGYTAHSPSVQQATGLTVTTGAVQEFSFLISETASAGVMAWTAGTVYLRFGLRLNSAETGLVVRVGEIRVTDATEHIAAAASATAAATSASSAATSATAAGTSATAASTSATTATTAAGTAGTHATNAATSASTASSAAAAAATSATVAAQVGAAALNPHPVFAAYPTTPGLPTGYTAWGTATYTRQTGQVSPYSMRVACGAGDQGGAYQDSNLGGLVDVKPGWYVIEADATLVSGALTGAGVLFQMRNAAGTTTDNAAFLSFPVDPDTNESVRGAGTVGVTYRYRKLVQVTWADAASARLYAMAHYSPFGSVAAANSLDFHRLAVRPATAGEISGRRADVNATTALAQIASESATRASETAALATRADTVEATLRTGSAGRLPDRPAVGGNFLAATSGTQLPTAAPLTAGTVVPVAGEGDVRQLTTAYTVASRGGLPVRVGKTFTTTARSRVTVDGTSNRCASGVLVYDSAWAYLGALGGWDDTSAVAADGWQEFTREITSATILASYATAAYVRAYCQGGLNASFTASGATWQASIVGLADTTRESAIAASVAVNAAAIASTNAALATLDSTVTASIASLSATVSSHTSALVDLEAGYAAARFELVAAASGGNPARFALVSDTYGSSLALDADQIFFGEQTYFDNAAETFNTLSADDTRFSYGGPFGDLYDLVMWQGADTVASGDETTANSLFAVDTDGQLWRNGKRQRDLYAETALNVPASVTGAWSDVVTFTLPSGPTVFDTFHAQLFLTTQASPSVTRSSDGGVAPSGDFEIVEQNSAGDTVTERDVLAGTWQTSIIGGGPTAAYVTDFQVDGAQSAMSDISREWPFKYGGGGKFVVRMRTNGSANLLVPVVRLILSVTKFS